MTVHTSILPDIPPWPQENCYDIAVNRPEMATWPDYTLHIDAITGERRTRREFIRRVEDGATALASPEKYGGLGLTPKDGFVGIMSENCLVCARFSVFFVDSDALDTGQDYPVIVLALFKLAIPISFIPSLLTPAESKTMLKLSAATTLFVSPRLLPIALEAARLINLPEDRIFILGGSGTGNRRSFADLIAAVRAKGTPKSPTAPVNDKTVAYMVFSSGTSGLPKGKLT
jgi:acyl-CoA synthetase (AMP-forming)/AMP-acid ligase II